MIHTTPATVKLPELNANTICAVLAKPFTSAAERLTMKIVLKWCHTRNFEENVNFLLAHKEEFGMGPFAFSYVVTALVEAHKVAMDALPAEQ